MVHAGPLTVAGRTPRLPGLAVEIAPGLDEKTRAVLENAFGVISGHLAGGFPPGAAAAVCGPEGLLGCAWGGWARLPPHGASVERDTVFDLASLTKVMATTPLCLMLEQAGAWTLDDPVSRWVSSFRHPAITLRHCLTHASGLPAHRRFWELADSYSGIRAALIAVDVEAPPGDRIVYSDLNFMLLGWAIEGCAGRPLDVLWSEYVARPLGMGNSGFRPPAGLRSRIAATEVRAVVHDENARALGGVAGHAGLFAPLDDVVKFARALIAPGRSSGDPSYGSPGAGGAGIGHPPEVRGLGWRLQPMPFAPGWPADAYGHTGFTGTCLVVAPGAGLAAVLLTNAVHPERRPAGAAAIRAGFHGALVPLVESRTVSPRS